MKSSSIDFEAITALLFFSFYLSGCGLIYTNVEVPRSYRSATPADVRAEKTDKIVTGEACNYSLLFLFAWGNGGYAAAAKNALKEEPQAVLYDVKADTRLKSVLGLYTRVCTVVTGKVASP